MATYVYDDFRVTFAPRAADGFDVRAVDAAGGVTDGVFRIPLSADELQQAVLSVARGNSRKAAPARPGVRAAPARDVGADDRPVVDAEHLGATLADALLTGAVGTAYESARERAVGAGRGLRLTLSLAGAPELLSVPWEFVYRRPRFLASQRHTPLVRLLDTGSLAPPPAIDSRVRILGVIASPSDLGPLDVVAERSRVEQALTKVRDLGRVELDWLEPATPRRLREALRDGSYHVVHYVGHSDFTDAGDGMLFLEDDARRSAPVDSTALANLLSDQSLLRLVVLNSCEGARTTLTDPYAGVATTLIQLGVPAVVAMQFEISDSAAIVFAEELYTNLIGRQDPIDAAVSEARKAIYIEVDKVEWATPVLFVRDPEIELFHFELPVAPLPPPPPPDLPPTDRAVETTGEEPVVEAAPPARRPKRWLAWVAAAVVVVAAGVLGAVLLLRNDDEGDDGGPATTVAAEGDGARPRTGFLAVQVLEPDGESHINTVDPTSDRIGVATDRPGATDTQGVWDRNTNRLAFSHERAADGPGVRVNYVIPGNGRGEDGRQVAPLIPWQPGEFEHFPAWTPDGALFYTRTDGCAPSRQCTEALRRATFDVTDDGEGFLDALSVASDDAVATGLAGVTAIAADPLDAGRVAVADARGLSIVETNGGVQLVQQATTFTALAFTPDGQVLLAATPGASAADSFLFMFTRTGDLQRQVALADLIGGADGGPAVAGLDGGDVILSLTPGTEGNLALALVSETLVELVLGDGGAPSIRDAEQLPGVGGLGNPRAVAF